MSEDAYSNLLKQYYQILDSLADTQGRIIRDWAEGTLTEEQTTHLLGMTREDAYNRAAELGIDIQWKSA